MSVVLKEGSRVAVKEARETVVVRERTPYGKFAGLIANTENKHETLVKERVEARLKWRQSQERLRLQKEVERRRRERAVYD